MVSSAREIRRELRRLQSTFLEFFFPVSIRLF